MERTTTIVTIEYKLMQATREDFVLHDQPDYTRIYFLKNRITGGFNGPYLLNVETVNSGALKNYLEHGMAWIVMMESP